MCVILFVPCDRPPGGHQPQGLQAAADRRYQGLICTKNVAVQTDTRSRRYRRGQPLQFHCDRRQRAADLQGQQALRHGGNARRGAAAMVRPLDAAGVADHEAGLGRHRKEGAKERGGEPLRRLDRRSPSECVARCERHEPPDALIQEVQAELARRRQRPARGRRGKLCAALDIVLKMAFKLKAIRILMRSRSNGAG